MSEPGQQGQQPGAQPSDQQQGQQQGQQPPWGSEADFNPEKAWNLIQGLRADKERLASRQLSDEQQTQLAEFEQWKQQNQTEQQRQAEALTRAQSESAKWRDTALTSRIEALAAVEFEYPADAITALGDLSKYVTAGGQIREDVIKADLEQVLEQRPRWRRSAQQEQSGPRLPWPNPAQGAGGQPSSSPNDHMNALIRAGRGGQ